MNLRSMRPEEIDSVIILFQYYRESVGISDDKYDENRLLETIREYCIRPMLFFKVAFQGQRPIGLVGGFLSQDPIESELNATIQFLYLLPEHESLSNYSILVDAFEAWAIECGARAVRAIDIGYKLDRLSDIYDQLGFGPIRLAVMNKELA